MNNQLPHCKDCPFFVKAIQSCPTQSLSPYQSDLLTIAWQLLLQIGSFTPYFFVFGLIVYTIVSKDKTKINLLACLFFQNFISVTIKAVVQQPRPEGACSDSFGFPSSHASFATSLWLYIIIQNWNNNQLINKTTIIYTAYFIIVVLSRYILNYHSPIQLLAGFIIGAISTIVMRRYVRHLIQLLAREDNDGYDIEQDNSDDKLYQDVKDLQQKMNSLQNIGQQMREMTYASQQRVKKLKQSNLSNVNDKYD